jgi:uncharacterized membrane protein
VQRQDRGFALLGAMMVLLIMAGFLGLMADTAHLQFARQRAQTAADAAAIAALHELEQGNTGGMLEAARGDAGRNGVKNGENGVSIDVHCPPLSGDHVSDTEAVEATVSQRSPTLFMGMFGQYTVGVGARAVAIRGADGRATLGE